ncbi:MAG TPA: hypothetical protein VGD63_10430 [Steroidobacteraceae bacterium]
MMNSATHYEQLPDCVMQLRPDTKNQLEQGWEQLGIAPRVAAVAPGYAVLVLTSRYGDDGERSKTACTDLCPLANLREFECPIPLEPFHQELRWHQRHNADPAHTYLRSLLLRVAKQQDDRIIA